MARRTHCKRGHPLTDDNVYLRPSYLKSRSCRECLRINNRKWILKRKKPPKVYTRKFPQPPLGDMQWAAGLFEGEGTVTIAKSGGKKRPGLTKTRVMVGNTDAEVTQFFFSRWGGHHRPRKPYSKRCKPSFEWAIEGVRAVFFLQDILPHIQTKRVRTRMALVLRSEEVRRAAPKQARATLHRMMQEIRELNRRGVPETEFIPDVSG